VAASAASLTVAGNRMAGPRTREDQMTRGGRKKVGSGGGYFRHFPDEKRGGREAR